MRACKKYLIFMVQLIGYSARRSDLTKSLVGLRLGRTPRPRPLAVRRHKVRRAATRRMEEEIDEREIDVACYFARTLFSKTRVLSRSKIP